MAQRRRSTSPLHRLHRSSADTALPRVEDERVGAAEAEPLAGAVAGRRPLARRIGLLLLGTISGIAFMLQAGDLTDWWRDLTAPVLGRGGSCSRSCC